MLKEGDKISIEAECLRSNVDYYIFEIKGSPGKLPFKIILNGMEEAKKQRIHDFLEKSRCDATVTENDSEKSII